MSSSSYTTPRQTSGWAVGLSLFAGLMMIIIGVFQVIVGVAAIIEDQFYVVTPKYAFDVDVTAWGWIHLLIGLVVGLAGWAVTMGQLWGRVIGIVVAGLSAIANFFFIPYYPIWSLLIIALDVFVIWALCVYGGRATAELSSDS